MALFTDYVKEELNMVARIQERRCVWPVFSRYEMREGRIVPAGGTKLRWYDPWVRYTRSRNENRGRPPYLSLASLVENLTGEARARGQDLVADAAFN
jgi:hypothetical protein